MGKPQRKSNRLPCFHYSTPGAYFVTVCTEGRKCLLGNIVGATIGRPPVVSLSKCGRITEQAIKNISNYYPTISVDNYVIMPNHIHLLLQIITDQSGRPMVAPTVSRVLQQLKGYISKEFGSSIWQKSFHDHVIRNEADYLRIWTYIENNPCRWREDCFYAEETPGGEDAARCSEEECL